MFALLTSLASCAYFLQHEEKAFLSWMRSTNQYFTGDEYHLRFGIYMTSARLVKEHNAANKGFTLSLNQFAAYTPAEYKALLGFKMELPKKTETQQKLPEPKPIKEIKGQNGIIVDWRTYGVVNAVKNQGQCGSCWTFSTVQAAESAYAINYGVLGSFSEQNLVDCVFTCSGCNGGLMTSAYDFIIAYQGGKFNLESEYPYLGVQGVCKFTKCSRVGSVSSYVNCLQGSETDLATKIQQYGPACVAIDASNYSFQLYSGGIYSEAACSSANLDHGVGCVGYGKSGTTKYWIVRNSWGPSWGEEGYIRMIWLNNQCGIASMATIPFV